MLHTKRLTSKNFLQQPKKLFAEIEFVKCQTRANQFRARNSKLIDSLASLTGWRRKAR